MKSGFARFRIATSIRFGWARIRISKSGNFHPNSGKLSLRDSRKADRPINAQPSKRNGNDLDRAYTYLLTQEKSFHFFVFLAVSASRVFNPFSTRRRIASEREAMRFSNRKSSIRDKRSGSTTKFRIGFSVVMALLYMKTQTKTINSLTY